MLKLGILGVSKILDLSIIEPIKEVDNISVYAIASRDEYKARQYAKEHNIPRYFQGYDNLLSCKEIDVVYIPLINSLHTEWIVKTADAGKHVMIEKPICICAKDFDRIEKAAKRNNVEIFECLMIQHHPFISEIKKIISSNVLGKILASRTIANYILTDKSNYRFSVDKGGGVFYDQAVYWLFLTLSIFDSPIKNFEGESDFDGINGVDQDFTAKLEFENEGVSILECSLKEPFKASNSIIFEHGKIEISNYFKPAFGKLKLKIEVDNHKLNQRQDIILPPMNYYSNQLKFVVNVLKRKINNLPLSISFKRIELIEEIYKHAKLKTPVLK